MRAKITKRAVDELKAASKPAFLFDTELAGFVFKKTPAGRGVYQFRYRMGGRITPLKTFTIGYHGTWTPDQARKHAQILLGEVRRGIDPAAERSRKRAEERGKLSVEALSADFLELYCQSKLKPRSYAEYERAFRSYINPRLGLVKIMDLTPGDVERLHHSMRAIPTTANRTIQVLSKFCSWSIRGGYRSNRDNPCRGLEKFKESPRKRYLSSQEIAALGAAIRRCETEGSINCWQAALFRCLLLSGMRRDELRLLKWKYVDLEKSLCKLPDSKTGAKDVPIPGPVRQILTSLPRIESNEFVFCGRVAGQPLVNTAKP